MTDDLYPDGDWLFVHGGGEYLDERGKAHWPALLRLRLDDAKAWRLVNELLTMLRDGAIGDHEFVFSGRLMQLEPEGDDD